MKKQLVLKRGKESSLQRRHPWIFSGAIERSVGDIEEGDLVDVVSSSGDFLARGYCAMGSIAVRVLSFDEGEEINEHWWEGKISAAFAVRRALGLVDSDSTNCYRLVHGEGDGMPGLVVDVYGKVAVMQAHSLGVHLFRDFIANGLSRVVGVESVYDKSSGTIGGVEGIVDEYLLGEGVEQTILENGIKYVAGWEGGQKTGLFIDQRESRALLRRYAKGRRVLNTFCYSGGFSLAAIAGGAVSVDSVDSSSFAIDMCRDNILANFSGGEGVTSEGVRHRELVCDALGFVRDLPVDAYDLIVLDPPAFAKHRGALKNALQAYKRLNTNAMRGCANGTLLFTFSCSQSVSVEQFRLAVFSASVISGRNVRVLEELGQPADHPVSIYHPEGHYLKGLLLYVE